MFLNVLGYYYDIYLGLVISYITYLIGRLVVHK